MRRGLTLYVVAVLDGKVAASPQTKCENGGWDAGASTNSGLKQIEQKLNEFDLFVGGERSRERAYLACRHRSR